MCMYEFIFTMFVRSRFPSDILLDPHRRPFLNQTILANVQQLSKLNLIENHL